MNIVRAPRAGYATVLTQHPLAEPSPWTGTPRLDVDPPATSDVVFCRDFVAEAAN